MVLLSCKELDSTWVGPYLVLSLAGLALRIQRHPDSPIILVHCHDLKKIPRPSGLVSWMDAARLKGVPTIPVLGASTLGHISQGSPSMAAIPPVEGAVLPDVDSGHLQDSFRDLNLIDRIPQEWIFVGCSQVDSGTFFLD